MMRRVRMGFRGLVSDEKMNAAPASTCSTGSTRWARVVLKDGRRVWGSLVVVPFAPAPVSACPPCRLPARHWLLEPRPCLALASSYPKRQYANLFLTAVLTNTRE
jgi:hypothetical protein